MKRKDKFIGVSFIFVIMIGLYITFLSNKESTKVTYDTKYSSTIDEINTDETSELVSFVLSTSNMLKVEPIVYDNMTMNQLIDKLNRSLNSTIAGTGELFATKSLELGVDPYLAVAIVLLETGCKWNCSTLVQYCNNVGGQKGGPSCGTGSYKVFNTLEEGINGFLENLQKNYYAYGLTTAELMNRKYAPGSTLWVSKVNQYIEEIKAK